MPPTAPVTPLPWRLPIFTSSELAEATPPCEASPVALPRSASRRTPAHRSQQRLPGRSPHIALAVFLAGCAIVCPPLGSLAWWYASAELDRVASGELWPEGLRALVFAKGAGVAATTACATFLACAVLARVS